MNITLFVASSLLLCVNLGYYSTTNRWGYLVGATVGALGMILFTV